MSTKHVADGKCKTDPTKKTFSRKPNSKANKNVSSALVNKIWTLQWEFMSRIGVGAGHGGHDKNENNDNENENNRTISKSNNWLSIGGSIVWSMGQ